jgi:hypothetical protein
MELIIRMNLDNAAFEGRCRNTEIRRILKEICKNDLRYAENLRSLRDINGNKIGYIKFTEDTSPEMI